MKQPLLLIFILWMHPAFCQPVISVWGSEDSLAVKRQVAQYLDDLDVRENIYLSVTFTSDMPEEFKGITLCADSAYFKKINSYQIIMVSIDVHLSVIQQRIALAHEMIHVKQYAKGELMVISNQLVLWKGRKYYYQRANHQYVLWEREADKNDNLLARRYKEQPDKPMELEKPLIASKINP